MFPDRPDQSRERDSKNIGKVFTVTKATKDNVVMPEPSSRSLPVTTAGRDVQPIVEKYRQAVEAVAGYMTRAVALLEDLYVEQDEIIKQLKTTLSKSKSLRRSDFDAIFANVLARRQRTKQTLLSLVDGYRTNRRELIEEVREIFNANLAQAVRAWPALKQRLLDEQDAGAGEVVLALRQVHVEQEELSAALSGLLCRGEKLRINDMKTVAKNLAATDSRGSAELAALLAMCESAGRDAGLKWQRLAG